MEKKNDVLVKLSLQKEEIINILKEKIIKGGHIISYVVPKLRYPDGTTLYDMSSFAAHKTQELFDSQKIQFVNELMDRKLIKRYDTDDVIRFEIHLAAEI